MGSDWQEISLNDVATLRNGAGIKQEFFAEQGIPLVRVSDFTQDSIDMAASRFVENEHAKKWSSYLLCKDDVIVATVGSWPPNWSSVVGKVIRVPEKAIGAIQNQNTCCILPNADLLDIKFLFYRLRLEDFAWHAANSSGGSANQARLPIRKLGDFSFCLLACSALAKNHRSYPWHSRRQNRPQPPNEHHPGSHGPRPVQKLVRRFRSGDRQGSGRRQPHPRTSPRPRRSPQSSGCTLDFRCTGFMRLFSYLTLNLWVPIQQSPGSIGTLFIQKNGVS